MVKVSAVAAACIAGVLAALPSRGAMADDLIILTNQGATPGVRELATAFSRMTGHNVSVIQEAGADLDRRLSTGPADLISGNPEQIEDLVKKGRVVAGTAVPYALASLGVSVRAGLPKPDISTPVAYRAALLAARSIGYSRGCSWHPCRPRDRGARPYRTAEVEDGIHGQRPSCRVFGQG